MVPFSVEIEDSQVQDITGVSSGFVNNGGSLAIKNLNATEVNLSGGLISVSGESGTLQLDTLQIDESDINVRVKMPNLITSLDETNMWIFFLPQAVVVIEGGAEGNIQGLDVHDINALNYIVLVDDPGSTVNIENANIRDINIRNAGEGWVGFEANDGGTVTISDSTVTDVVGSRAIFSSSGNAEITIERVDVVNSRGADVSSGGLPFHPAALIHAHELFSFISSRLLCPPRLPRPMMAQSTIAILVLKVFQTTR